MGTWRPTEPAGEKRRTFEQVLDRIRQAIRAGDLRPGDRLPPERELAEALNVGRTSVREAIRVLEALDIVQVRVGSGPEQGVTIRSSPGDQLAQLIDMWMSLEHVGLREVVQFREAVEGWSCGVVARDYGTQDVDEKVIGELSEITEEMQEVSSKEAYLELDATFHIQIVEATGNRLAGMVATALRGSMRGYMLAAFKEIDNWDQERNRLTQEHINLLELIRDRRSEDAQQASVAHVRCFYQRWLSVEI